MFVFEEMERRAFGLADHLGDGSRAPHEVGDFVTLSAHHLSSLQIAYYGLIREIASKLKVGLDTSRLLCDILQHIDNVYGHGRDIVSVRKRQWTTRSGEQKEAWIVDYFDQEGDRHIETFQRKKDADDYHATVRVDVRQGIHTAPSKSATV